MDDQRPESANRLEACLAGALQAAPPLQMALMDDLLLTVEVLADGGGQDPEALRLAGLTKLPDGGLAASLLRALPYGLLTPGDRPRIRRGAYHCALQAGADEGTAMVAVATALLACDLLTHDLETSLIRVHQTLLEEAPSGLLGRLRPAEPGALAAGDVDPALALQLAISALAQAEGPREAATAVERIAAEQPVPLEALPLGAEESPAEEPEVAAEPPAESEPVSAEAVLEVTAEVPALAPMPLTVAPMLAAALAGLRDGGATIPEDHPLRDRLRRDLAALLEASGEPQPLVAAAEPRTDGG